jgi:hypothetical protein
VSDPQNDNRFAAYGNPIDILILFRDQAPFWVIFSGVGGVGWFYCPDANQKRHFSNKPGYFMDKYCLFQR